jgi:hypothetical protein
LAPRPWRGRADALRERDAAHVKRDVEFGAAAFVPALVILGERATRAGHKAFVIAVRAVAACNRVFADLV